MKTDWFLMHIDQRTNIMQVATRLYSERTLNADEMRDLAHRLTASLDSCIRYEPLPPKE